MGLQLLLPLSDALGGLVKDPEGVGGRIDLDHRQAGQNLGDLALLEHVHLGETKTYIYLFLMMSAVGFLTSRVIGFVGHKHANVDKCTLTT